MRLSRPWLRVAPFIVLAGCSLIAAIRAPEGRKPFAFDTDLSMAALRDSLPNPPHMWAAAAILLTAALATGIRRLPLAVGLTVLVGLSWEVAQTTVVGHHARLRDLVPDLVGALGAALLVILLARLRSAWQSRPPSRP
jgi:hypothetical protein